jgi:hypothetical protein
MLEPYEGAEHLPFQSGEARMAAVVVGVGDANLVELAGEPEGVDLRRVGSM